MRTIRESNDNTRISISSSDEERKKNDGITVEKNILLVMFKARFVSSYLPMNRRPNNNDEFNEVFLFICFVIESMCSTQVTIFPSKSHLNFHLFVSMYDVNHQHTGEHTFSLTR